MSRVTGIAVEASPLIGNHATIYKGCQQITCALLCMMFLLSPPLFNTAPSLFVITIIQTNVIQTTIINQGIRCHQREEGGRTGG